MVANTRLKRIVGDPDGLQKIVGLIIGIVSIIADISNAATAKDAEAVSRDFVPYFISISLFGAIGFITAFWRSVAAKWIQVSIFLITAILGALTTGNGDLTSGLFLISGLVLIYEYRFGRRAFWVGAAVSLLAYPSALAISFYSSNKAFVAQSAVIMLMISCLIVFYGAVILRHELRHKQDKELLEDRVRERTAELEDALSEKSVLLQEVHHRVNNNLQIIASILQMEIAREGDLAARSSKEKTLRRIYAMGLVHELLYQSGELEFVDLARYAARLIDSFRSGSAVAFGLSADSELRVGLDFSLPFGLLLNELLCNSREHAFPEGRTGSVEVCLRGGEAGAVILSVADDGVGLPDGVALQGSRTLGFAFTEAIVQQLHGKAELVRNGGTRWTIVFPRMEPRSWMPPKAPDSPS